MLAFFPILIKTTTTKKQLTKPANQSKKAKDTLISTILRNFVFADTALSLLYFSDENYYFTKTYH